MHGAGQTYIPAFWICNASGFHYIEGRSTNQMSALLENTVYCYKATIENQTCSFFRIHSGFHDMEHTQIARARMRVWSETINCVRYQCTLDWYLNRYIVEDEDEGEKEGQASSGKYDEYLILRILCRSAPSVTQFNKEGFIAGINAQVASSKLVTHIKSYYTKMLESQSASKT